ncbi:MAG: hypothetical protein AB7D27_17965 [Desulfomicrobium sp.]
MEKINSFIYSPRVANYPFHYMALEESDVRVEILKQNAERSVLSSDDYLLSLEYPGGNVELLKTFDAKELRIIVACDVWRHIKNRFVEPRWIYWMNLQTWTIEEAAQIFHGHDPIQDVKLGFKIIHYRELFWEYAPGSYHDMRNLILDAIASGVLEIDHKSCWRHVRIKDLIAWVGSLCIPIEIPKKIFSFLGGQPCLQQSSEAKSKREALEGGLQGLQQSDSQAANTEAADTPESDAGETAAPESEACAEGEPVISVHNGFAPIATLPVDQWGLLTVEVLADGKDLKVSWAGKSAVRTYQEAGFMNQRNQKPVQAWGTLYLFADQKELPHTAANRSQVESKVASLRKKLSALFPDVQGDPLPHYREGKKQCYRPVFDLRRLTDS